MEIFGWLYAQQVELRNLYRMQHKTELLLTMLSNFNIEKQLLKTKLFDGLFSLKTQLFDGIFSPVQQLFR